MLIELSQMEADTATAPGKAFGTNVTGYLQDDDIGCGFSNNYNTPFDTIGSGLINAGLSFTTGGQNKFQYMFSQFWDSATPPELTLNIAFLAKKKGDDLKTKINTLFDMFATSTSATGQFVPPGGLHGLPGGYKAMQAAMAKGESGGDAFIVGLQTAFSQRRTVMIVIGEQSNAKLTFKGLLPERVEFKGKFPLTEDGNFVVALCTCTFKKANIITVGDKFIQ